MILYNAGEFDALMYSTPVCGSSAPPPQPAPPMAPGIVSVPTIDGGVNSLPARYAAIVACARALIAGVKSTRSESPKPCRAKGAGLVGNGWVRAAISPGTSLAGTGRSSIGQMGR